MQGLHGTGQRRETKCRPIEPQMPDAEEVFKGLFPQVLPAQDGGKGEQGHGDADKHRAAPAQHRLKGQNGQPGAVEGRARAGVRGAQDAGGADAEAGDGADHHGVEKGAGHADVALLHRVVGGGGGRNDGGGAHARLIGKAPPGDAEVDAPEPGGGPGREGHGEEINHRPGQGGAVAPDHRETGGQIEKRHGGNQNGGDSGDAADAAQHGKKSQHRHHSAGQQGRDVENAVQGLGDGVGLGHVADAERGQNCGEGEEKSQQTAQPPGGDGLAHGVHGAAGPLAPGIDLPVFDRQHALGEFGTQAEGGGEFHPHQGTGAAGGESSGHTHDVSCADGGSQRRHQGGKGGHGPGAAGADPGLTAQSAAQGVAQIAPGEKPGPNGEIDGGPHQQHQHPRAPHLLVRPLDPLGKRHNPAPFTPGPRPGGCCPAGTG